MSSKKHTDNNSEGRKENPIIILSINVFGINHFVQICIPIHVKLT